MQPLSQKKKKRPNKQLKTHKEPLKNQWISMKHFMETLSDQHYETLALFTFSSDANPGPV